jgi:rhodanese-related sulfurtransferase
MMKWFILLPLCVIGLLVIACSPAAPATPQMSSSPATTTPPQPSTSYIDVTPQEVKTLIDSTADLVIIDVSHHYADGHLPGAVSYYLGDGSLDRAIPTLDKNGKYQVYCHIDSVAIQGAKALVDAGFTTVYRLEGNYRAWVDARYPVEK